MEFLVVFTNTRAVVAGPPADFDDRMAEDARHLQRLYADGGLRRVWALDRAEHGGAALLEAGSVDEARALLAAVPLVRVGYNDYELLPLAPYPGLGPS